MELNLKFCNLFCLKVSNIAYIFLVFNSLQIMRFKTVKNKRLAIFHFKQKKDVSMQGCKVTNKRVQIIQIKNLVKSLPKCHTSLPILCDLFIILTGLHLKMFVISNAILNKTKLKSISQTAQVYKHLLWGATQASIFCSFLNFVTFCAENTRYFGIFSTVV